MKSMKKGFTIVELALSMVFIGLLLLSIALVTIHVTDIYQKGLTIRTVNSTGQEIIDELSRAISTAPTKNQTYRCGNGVALNLSDACSKDGAYLYIYHQNYGIANIKGQQTEVPTNGVFCSGRYSYIWNTGYVLGDYYGASSNRATLEYNVKGSNEKKKITDFRLIRIRDDNSALCKNHAPDYKKSNSNEYQITSAGSEPKEMLTASDNDLAIYDMVIFRPTQHTLTMHSFFSGTFILGTIEGGVDITSVDNYCTDAPDNLATDFNYCMINKFNFAIRATGELTDDEKIEKQRYSR